VTRFGGALLTAAGLAAVAIAALVRPTDAQAAAAQDWSPFVLVAGLLLVGLIADGDGLFAAAGERVARLARSGIVLFIAAAAMIVIVTALLNLDTSVAFLTPVLVYTARSRGEPEAPMLLACLLLSNAGSLFLPGSNLTNLIVLGHLHLTGGQFLARMWAPALAAAVVTALVIAVAERRALRVSQGAPAITVRPRAGLGLVAVGAATVVVVALPAPAPWVAGIGVLAVGIRILGRRVTARRAFDVVGLPVLVALFGLAVALGTLARAWSGPATLLSHTGVWGTAGIGAGASILANNLPAASLLAAHRPEHPFALLVGLNLGPNLFVTGSLAWILWLRAARSAGARPSIAQATRVGAIAVPLSIVAAVAALYLTS
jgi:arsenical pump membrane protein